MALTANQILDHIGIAPHNRMEFLFWKRAVGVVFRWSARAIKCRSDLKLKTSSGVKARNF